MLLHNSYACVADRKDAKPLLKPGGEGGESETEAPKRFLSGVELRQLQQGFDQPPHPQGGPLAGFERLPVCLLGTGFGKPVLGVRLWATALAAQAGVRPGSFRRVCHE